MAEFGNSGKTIYSLMSKIFTIGRLQKMFANPWYDRLYNVEKLWREDFVVEEIHMEQKILHSKSHRC